MDNLSLHKLAFSAITGLSPDNARTLLDLAGGEERFFEMTQHELASLARGDSRIFSREYRDKLLESARHEADITAERRIRFIYFTDEDYPQRLLDTDNAPLRLFVAGDPDLDAERIIAVVGTRHSTPYGLSMVNRIIADMASARSDILVVSGLAYGTDISGHRAAMKNGLPTVGVLAHGLSTIYPAAHRDDVADMLAGGGGVITEYGFDAPVHRGNFLARNRIVAGLCDCLLLVESGEKGGAIVTSRLAGDYGRRLMAIPGRATDPYSQGCNRLISLGMAQLITSAEEILDAMEWNVPHEGTQKELFISLTPEEQKIVDMLKENGVMTATSIASALSLSPGKLTSLLMTLEFKGTIANLPGAKVMLNPTF